MTQQMIPREFPPVLDLGPLVIAVPGEVDWGSADAYLKTPTHRIKGKDKYIPPPVRRSPLMKEYYRLHPTCNAPGISQTLNLCLTPNENQLAKTDPTKLRDAYKVLVESAQKIDVIIEEDQAGEDLEYFNNVFIKDSLEAKGIDHVRFVKICLEERAELVQ
jgi:hypothetical protein